MRIRNGYISIDPVIPDNWDSYSFNIRFRGNLLNFQISQNNIRVINKQGGGISVIVGENKFLIDKGSDLLLEGI